ncbi:MAG: hypothetical protein SFW67_26490 [Myxococcaceae bacterium]|nr:hypothetical protein [Myxococcaceae bacterium]
MLSLIAATVLAGLPTLAPFQPPLALFSVEVIQDGPSNIASNGDSLIPYGADTCAARSISTMRAMGGGLSMIERTLTWLEGQPGVEAKLFGKRGALGEVMKHVSTAAIAPRTSCVAPKLVDGWRWSLDAAPKLCAVKSDAPTNERWLLVKDVPAAAVVVNRSPDPCQSRVSMALFDAKGKTRVLLHADFAGAMSATLVGPKCRVELTYDPTLEAFKAEWKSCKG